MTTPIKHHQRTRAVLASHLPPLQRLLLIAISDHLSDGNDYCWPSQPRLCSMTGLSARTLQRHLCALVESDVLYIETSPGKASRYMIDWSALANPRQDDAPVSVTPRQDDAPVRMTPPSERRPTPVSVTPHPRQDGAPPPSERHPKKGKEEGEGKRTTTTPTSTVVESREAPRAESAPASPKPIATPAAVASAERKSSPPPQRAEDRPTSEIPVVGARLVSLGIHTLGDLAAYSRDALYTLTVGDTPFYSGELDLIETTLRRANLTQVASGRAQQASDSTGPSLRLLRKPWEDKPIVPTRKDVFDWDGAVAEWIRLNSPALNSVRDEIREHGGGWPELRIWLAFRVEDPDAVIDHLQQHPLSAQVA